MILTKGTRFLVKEDIAFDFFTLNSGKEYRVLDVEENVDKDKVYRIINPKGGILYLKESSLINKGFYSVARQVFSSVPLKIGDKFRVDSAVSANGVELFIPDQEYQVCSTAVGNDITYLIKSGELSIDITERELRAIGFYDVVIVSNGVEEKPAIVDKTGLLKTGGRFRVDSNVFINGVMFFNSDEEYEVLSSSDSADTYYDIRSSRKRHIGVEESELVQFGFYGVVVFTGNTVSSLPMVVANKGGLQYPKPNDESVLISQIRRANEWVGINPVQLEKLLKLVGELK